MGASEKAKTLGPPVATAPNGSTNSPKTMKRQFGGESSLSRQVCPIVDSKLKYNGHEVLVTFADRQLRWKVNDEEHVIALDDVITVTPLKNESKKPKKDKSSPNESENSDADILAEGGIQERRPSLNPLAKLSRSLTSGKKQAKDVPSDPTTQVTPANKNQQESGLRPVDDVSDEDDSLAMRTAASEDSVTSSLSGSSIQSLSQPQSAPTLSAPPSTQENLAKPPSSPPSSPMQIRRANTKDSENSFVVHVVKRRTSNHAMWKRVEYVFVCPSPTVCATWVDTLHTAITNETHRPRNLLVFVNPYGGRKKASSIYAHKVAPVFKLADISTKVIETTHAGHCGEVLSSSDLKPYDGVVVVGGDGLFNEALNGLLTTDYTHLRVGLIPAGSTNTIVYSTTGIDDPTTSALHIVVGDRMSLDVASVRVNGQIIRYAVSVASYGFFGDVVKDSENFRWMGPARYDYSGFRMYLGHNPYSAIVAYKEGPRPMDKKLCQTGCTVCAPTPACTTVGNTIRNEVTEEEKNMKSIRESMKFEGDTASAFQHLTKSRVEEGWKTVDGEFIYLNAAVMSCRAPKKCVMGLSPYAHLSDGCMDLIMVKNCNHADYLLHLLRIADEQADQFDFPFVEVHRVNEFMMECRGEETQWSVDGELLPPAHAVHFKVHSNLVHLFARRPEPKPKPKDKKGLKAATEVKNKEPTAQKDEEDKGEGLQRRTERLEGRVGHLEELVTRMSTQYSLLAEENQSLLAHIRSTDENLRKVMQEVNTLKQNQQPFDRIGAGV